MTDDDGIDGNNHDNNNNSWTSSFSFVLGQNSSSKLAETWNLHSIRTKKDDINSENTESTR